GPHVCRGTDRLCFVEHCCQFLDILLLHIAADMRHHRIHIQCKENLLTNRVLMPQAGNVEFVTAEKILDNANELHCKILLIAAEAVGVVQVQLPCCTENEILQAEIL